MKRHFLIGIVAALLLVPAGAMANDFSCLLSGDGGFASISNPDDGSISASILTSNRVEGATLGCPSGGIDLDPNGRGVGSANGIVVRACSLTVETDGGTFTCSRLDDAGPSAVDDEGASVDLRIRGNIKSKKGGRRLVVRVQNNSNTASVATEIEAYNAAGDRVGRKAVRALTPGETVKVKITVRTEDAVSVVVDPDDDNNDPRRGNNEKDV